jgi:hypothetical protein
MLGSGQSTSKILISHQQNVPTSVEGLVDIGRSELHKLCDDILLSDLARNLEDAPPNSRCAMWTTKAMPRI